VRRKKTSKKLEYPRKTEAPGLQLYETKDKKKVGSRTRKKTPNQKKRGKGGRYRSQVEEAAAPNHQKVYPQGGREKKKGRGKKKKRKEGKSN